MLSCEEVRAELPCIETGEPATGAVRDHLAACEACRTEAGRVRAELEQMRGDLAALAPSPFLEDAVLEAARELRTASPGARRSSTWIGAAVALAAATLLVGVLWLDRNGTGSAPAGEGELGEADPGGPGRISMPPTAAAVEAARRETEQRARALVAAVPGKRGAAPGEYIHVAQTKDGNQQLTYAPRILPAKDGAPHRWVFRERDVVERNPMFTVVGVPAPGVATLGRALLARIGNAKGEAAKDPVVAGLRRLSITPGKSAYLDLEVADPSGRGATAKVRVLVSDLYTGSLVLEEPLGRALGLQHFEIPGRVTLAGDLSIGARRAWARIRIAGIDFDETVEVQVLEAGPVAQTKQGAADAPPPGRILLAGERPDEAKVSDSLALAHAGGQAFVISSQRPATRSVAFDRRSQRQAGIELRSEKETCLALHYLEGSSPECYVLLSSADAAIAHAEQRLALQRVTLPGPFPVGAEAIVARVWRGATALPSRESASATTVAEDGSVSFVRVAGERGPLRMRLLAKDESVRWYTFDPDEDRIQPLLVEIDGGGQVTIGTHTIALVDKAPTGNRLSADPPALAALVRELKAASRKAGWQEGTAEPSPLAIRVVSGRNEPWAAVHAILYGAAQAGITNFQFALRGDPAAGVPFRLPVDRGLVPVGQDEGYEEVTEEPAGGPPIENPKTARKKGRHMRVELRVRRDRGVTRFSWPYEDDGDPARPAMGDMSLGSRDLTSLQAAYTKLSSARAPKRRLQVELNLLEADLAPIPYAEMRNLIVVLRTAGVDDIFMMMPVGAGR